MQADERRTHLAICSFFNTATGYSANTTFRVFRPYRKSVAPLEQRKKEKEVYELTAPGMMILRRPKK